MPNVLQRKRQFCEFRLERAMFILFLDGCHRIGSTIDLEVAIYTVILGSLCLI
jgi:hypothetical protein